MNPLFSVYPHLEERLEWIDLGLTCARIEKFQTLPNTWVKRNDDISLIYGGNKAHRLAYMLGEAKKQGKSHVITLGSLGSNHCVATAAYCNFLGMKCTTLLGPQPLTEYVRNNLKRLIYYKADVRYINSNMLVGVAFYSWLRLRYPRAYFIGIGGSGSLGMLGALTPVFELGEQIREGELPEPDVIYYPTASNGGLAALAVGLYLQNIKSKIIGVRTGTSYIGPIALNTEKTVRNAVYELSKKLKALKVPLIMPEKISVPELENNYFGSGYGQLTSEGRAAMEYFKKNESIELDPCYTAKACACLLDQKQSEDKKVLYWHTYSSVGLNKEMEKINIDSFLFEKKARCTESSPN